MVHQQVLSWLISDQRGNLIFAVAWRHYNSWDVNETRRRDVHRSGFGHDCSRDTRLSLFHIWAGKPLYTNAHTECTLCLVVSSLLLLLSVHIFPAEAYTEPEEGAVCHSTGQCSSSSHCSSFKKARKKEEAGNKRKGWPEDSGNTRVAHEDRTALIIKERCEDRILCFFFRGGGCCLVSFSSGCCETFMKHSVRKCFSFGTAPFTGRQMMSPSTRSNDTMSGISSLAPSKHSSSSHSLASVSFILFFFCHVCFIFDLFIYFFHHLWVYMCLHVHFWLRCESQALQISLPIHPHLGRQSLWWKSQGR